MKENAYKKAGVDIEAGAALVERIRPHVGKTRRPGVINDIGGFGAFFDLAEAGYGEKPLLVSATDGVGTKLKVAIETGRHEAVGIDLVAMCVNDIIVQGAEPLFFLDYFATGRLDNNMAETVIAGIAQGCTLAGCALIGGETAEMPGMYGDGDYDLAGFAVGAVDRDKVVNGEGIAAGDVILGLASDGVHSNGFSLIRRIVDESGLTFDSPAPFDEGGRTLGEVFMTPTRLYVKPLLAALRETGAVKGLAHITGGGLTENIPRVLPAGLTANLDAAAWPLPPVFGWLKQTGDLTQEDFALTFNCGIGMAVICAASEAAALKTVLADAGETVCEIGTIAAAAGGPALVLGNAERAWSL